MKNSKSHIPLTLIMLLSFAITAFATHPSDLKMTIILSGNYDHFHKTKDGFKKYITGQFPKIQIKEFTYSKKDKNILRKKIEYYNPNLIFSIGNSASVFAKTELKKFPITFSMVHSPEKFSLSDREINHRLSGVTVDIPNKIKLEFLVELLGNDLNITTIYSKNSFSEVQKLEAECKNMKLNLVSYPVRKANELKFALRKVKKKSIFWMLPDAKIYDRHTLIQTLETLNKKNCIILAPTDKFLQLKHNSAHIAVTIDPEENGTQAAKLAIKILSDDEKIFPIESPKFVDYFAKKSLKHKGKLSDKPIRWIK